MQRIFFITIGILLSFYSYSFAQTSNDQILGKWTNADKTRILEFVKNETSYDAIIRKIDNQDLIGKKQITGLKTSGKNTFNNGILFIFNKNREASVSATLVTDKRLELKASIGFMSKRETWTKL